MHYTRRQLLMASVHQRTSKALGRDANQRLQTLHQMEGSGRRKRQIAAGATFVLGSVGLVGFVLAFEATLVTVLQLA